MAVSTIGRILTLGSCRSGRFSIASGRQRPMDGRESGIGDSIKDHSVDAAARIEPRYLSSALCRPGQTYRQLLPTAEVKRRAEARSPRSTAYSLLPK